MSLVKRVDEALARIRAGDPEGALLPACAAVESTANRESPSFKSRERRFKTFFATYGWIIGRVVTGAPWPRRLQIGAAPAGLPLDANGTCATDDLLFEVVRCGIVYATHPSDYVILEPGTGLRCEGGKYRVSNRLPLGLVAAVILSPENAKQRLPQRAAITLDRREVDANDLWGKAEMVASLLQAGAL